MSKCVLLAALLFGAAWGGRALADETAPIPVAAVVAAAPTFDRADTVWVMVSAALVMLMTPGLALFYGGLVRKKNVLSILMQCFMVMCLMTVQWIVFGYSLAFGPDVAGIIGKLDWAWFKGVGMAPSAYAPHIPHATFAIFQMMFAVITPGLIIGAFAERIRFSAFCLFCLLWSTFVYDPVCHWVWGRGGFLGALGGAGAVDFAGGIVVHINAGMAALAAAVYLGRRQGYPHSISPPHNLPLAVFGAGLLWFGWFGFNAGSALAMNGTAVNAFLVTHMAGAVAGITWCVLDWIKFGRPTTLGMITGAVAGLAAVTPGAGYVDLVGATWIGILSSVVCWIFVTAIKAKFMYDDALDAFGVHGVGGIWGSLAVGLWATKLVNADGVDGLFAGNVAQLVSQLKAIGICMVYSFGMSMLLLKFVDMVATLRVSEQDERIGLDLTQHREAGYTVIE